MPWELAELARLIESTCARDCCAADLIESSARFETLLFPPYEQKPFIPLVWMIRVAQDAPAVLG